MRSLRRLLSDGLVHLDQLPASSALPTPPHLATPHLTTVTESTWTAWQERVQDGFHETINPEWAALGKTLFPATGCFGMRVDDHWVATASSTPRLLSVPGGGALACSAVSDVTVAPAYRRRGIVREMMTHQLTSLAKQGAPMAGLWASESSIYGRFGYGIATWQAEVSGATNRTAFLADVHFDGSSSEVDEQTWLGAAQPVWEQVRGEQPGMFDRAGDWWRLATWDPEKERNGFTARRYLLHFDTEGRVDGVGSFEVKPDWSTGNPEGKVRIGPVFATTPSAYAGLWRYQLDVDLATSFSSSGVAVDEPLLHLLAAPRALNAHPIDGLYLRILDVVAALETRHYCADIDVVLQVQDSLLDQVAGRYRIHVREGRAAVARTQDAPDVTLDTRELACIYLGGTTICELHRAGRVTEHSTGSAQKVSAAFDWPRAPHCPDHF